MALKRVVFAAGFVAYTLLAAGCSDKAVNPRTQNSDDRQMVTGTLAIQSQFLDDGYLDAETNTNLAAAIRGARTPSSAGATAGATVDPFFFWRQIVHRTLTFEFAFADSDSTSRPTTATVTVTRDFSGAFNIVPRDPNNPNAADPNEAHVIHKPLLDHWVRQFLLKRIDTSGGTHPFWRLASVSDVTVTSQNATTQITSVHLQSATKDTTITDPTVLVPLRNTLRLTNDVVNVTVTTPRNDDVVYLYHAGGRVRLAAQGNGTYTGTFTPGTFNGWRHFAVNAMSHGTLFDDTAAYDSKAWVVAYIGTNGPSVDYLP